jgi:predicted permease
LLNDIRLASRGLLRTPLFSAGILLVLALGIGANGAVFSLVRAVLLEPLPYRDPESVVMLWDARRSPTFARRGATARAIHIWQTMSPGTLDGVAALKLWDGNPEAWFDVVLDDRAERLRAGLVTSNFFEVLGSTAALGRTFSPADEAEGHLDLVVLSHGLWQRIYGGDPAIVGRAVTFITGRADRAPRVYTVAGVLPAAFRFTYPTATELWAIHPSAHVRAADERTIEFNGAVARLAPGQTAASAAARLAGLPVSSRADANRFTFVEPVTDWVGGEARPSMLLLSSVAALLLLIACATAAGALLVRLAERERDLALRASLGARRARLVRHLLVEGAVLSAAGAAAGAGLALALLPVLRSLVPPVVPRGDEMSASWWMAGFAGAAMAIATVLSAIAPALHGARVQPADTLRRTATSASAGRGALRWRWGLVALQSATSTALLVGAALLLASFWRLGRVDLGFDGRDVVTVEMRLMHPKYRDAGALARFQADLLDRVRAIPGVAEAGMTTAVPFRGTDFTYGFASPSNDRARIGANGRTVDPAFFQVMRIPLVRGRLFDERDTPASPPVAVVSESFARAMFGEADPIGQVFSTERYEVVGLVGDLRYERYDRDPRPAFYLPRTQEPTSLICLVVRARPGAGDLAAALHGAVRSLDPAVPAMHLTTIDRILAESVADRRFYTAITATFAALALLLTATGLFVVIARAVVERRREMAIRMAVGAEPARLVRLVARQGLAPALAGTAAGLAGAWAGASMLQQFLFHVSPHDPVVYACVGVAMPAIAAAACVLPARRIGRMAPARILGSE